MSDKCEQAAPDGLVSGAPQGLLLEPSETHDFEDDSGPVPAHRHRNGGGWVADTAAVAGSAFVGPEAGVFDSAKVLDCASVLDSAWVCGRAEVGDNARVSGDSVVEGNARLFGDAQVADNAYVGGSARLGEGERVGGDTQLYECDSAWPSVTEIADDPPGADDSALGRNSGMGGREQR